MLSYPSSPRPLPPPHICVYQIATGRTVHADDGTCLDACSSSFSSSSPSARERGSRQKTQGPGFGCGNRWTCRSISMGARNVSRWKARLFITMHRTSATRFEANGVEARTHRKVEPSANTVTSPVCVCSGVLSDECTSAFRSSHVQGGSTHKRQIQFLTSCLSTTGGCRGCHLSKGSC